MTGLFGIVIAPFISRLLRFFPAAVTGSIITVVLAVILVLLRSGSGVVRNTAVPTGIVVNYGLTLATGTGSLNGIETQPWFNMAVPVQFGIPTFDLVACVSMCLVMMVVMIERSGMFLNPRRHGGSASPSAGPRPRPACGRRRQTDRRHLQHGPLHFVPTKNWPDRRIEPHGLDRRRRHVRHGGRDQGLRTLGAVDCETRRGYVFVVAIAIGAGMTPLVALTLFKSAPAVLKTLSGCSILLASITAVALNAFFNSGTLATTNAPVAMAGHV